MGFIVRSLVNQGHTVIVLNRYDDEGSQFLRECGAQTICINAPLKMNTTAILEDAEYSVLIMVRRLLKEPLRLVAGFFLTLYYLWRLRPDVLFLSDVTFPQCAFAGFVLGVPTVCQVQAELIRGRWGVRRRIVLAVLGRCRKIFGITPRHIAPFAAASADPTRCTVIRNTVDVAAAAVAADRPSTGSPLNAIAGKRVVSYFGGATLIKGYRLLLEVATRIAAKRDDVAFIFAGAFHRSYASAWGVGTDPGAMNLAETKFLFDWIARHRLEDQLFVVGERADVLDIMRRSDVVIVPHQWPHNSRAVVEAFAVGTPVLATDDVFNRDLIDEGVNGLLASYGQVEEWMQQLERCLDDRELASRLSAGGRSVFASTFDPSRVAEEISDLFESVHPSAAAT
jgi:glycosyltransferase involved in cell wall biosynthesis